MTHCQSPDHHADTHLDVGKALILGQHGTSQRDETVRQREAENEDEIDAHAEGADHLGVVAGGAHCHAEVRLKKQV